ncbi:MAG: hypothetical protein WCW30_03580 [Candidatus Gracilibacteria bacterium]|jgi:hypothetical protein
MASPSFKSGIYHRFKKRFALVLVGLFLAGSLLPFSTLAKPVSYDATQDGNACGAKILTFLVSFLGSDNFTDYWADFFVRNRCQQQDIFALQDEIDSLLRELYEADCSIQGFTEIQDEIRKKKMELYFVRHIVPAFEDSFLEKDLDALDYKFIAEDLLLTMDKEFVGKKGWLKTEELATFFSEWQTRYEYRIETYKDCNDSPWQEVGDKFRKLLQTLKDVKDLFLFKDIKKTWAPYKEDIKKQWEQEGILNANGEWAGGFGATMGAFLKKNIELNIRNLPSKKDLEDIMANFEALGNLVTTSMAQTSLQAAETDFQVLTDKATLKARYQLLYQQGNVEITARLTSKIKTLCLIVRESTSGGNGVNLNTLATTAKEIRKKQGSGNP